VFAVLLQAGNPPCSIQRYEFRVRRSAFDSCHVFTWFDVRRSAFDVLWFGRLPSSFFSVPLVTLWFSAPPRLGGSKFGIWCIVPDFL